MVMLRSVAGESDMKSTVRVLAALAGAAVATTALAEPRVSEAAYLKAARCQGLAHAGSLGAVDTSGIDSFMKVQGEGRDPRVRNQARTIRSDATEGAEAANNKARLIQERDARCSAWLKSNTAVANSGAAAAR